MQKKFDVIALGELLIDFTENGMSSQGNPLLEANPGGAPCNVLSMLQNLNKHTAFIGKVGNDGFGKMLKEKVESRGINTDCLKLDDIVHTTLAIVTKTNTGDRDFSFYRKPGADININVSDVSEDYIKSAKVFHFGTLSFTDDPAKTATLKALEIAKRNDLIITFDPNLRPPLWDSLDDAHYWTDIGLKYADVLKISDNEIEWFTGLDDYNQGIDKLFNDYPNLKLIAVTLGPNGSIASTRTSRTFTEAFKTTKTIETTGCGDTFMACLINSVLEKGLDQNEENLNDTLKFANAAASIVSTRIGALMVMPTLDEIKVFLKEQENKK